jgi:hypothetical protein
MRCLHVTYQIALGYLVASVLSALTSMAIELMRWPYIAQTFCTCTHIIVIDNFPVILMLSCASPYNTSTDYPIEYSHAACDNRYPNTSKERDGNVNNHASRSLHSMFNINPYRDTHHCYHLYSDDNNYRMSKRNQRYARMLWPTIRQWHWSIKQYWYITSLLIWYQLGHTTIDATF